MKTFFTVLLFLCFVINTSFSQNKLYKTIDDFHNDKPIEGYSIAEGSWRMLLGSESIELVHNGKTERVKLDKLPSDLFTNGNGMLMRVYNKDLYYVIVEGPVCYYIHRVEGSVGYENNGTVWIGRNSPTDNAPADYYSETINGEIKKLKDSVLEKYLEDHGLKKQYDSDKVKRAMKDSVDGYISKQKNKRIKYIKLLNEKMK